jgi:hypothetical protein
MTENNNVPILSRNHSGRYKSGSRVDRALIVETLLLIAVGFYLAFIVITLLRAVIVDAEVLSSIQSVVTLVASLGGILFFLWVALRGTWADWRKDLASMLLSQKELQGRIMMKRSLRWLVYGGALALLAVIHLVAFPMLAEREIDTALSADTAAGAKKALEAAVILGRDGDEDLRRAVLDALDQPEAEHTVRLVKLYHERKPRDVELADLFSRSVKDAVQDRRPERATALLGLLLIVDKTQAVELTRMFNVNGVAAWENGDYPLARTCFAVVAAFDAAHPTADTMRTPSERANALFQLAAVQERDREFAAARASYESLLDLDDTLLDAYYALSSLLLVEFADNPERLEEAVAIATEGRNRIDPARCINQQNLKDSEILYESWTCFLLLTTEAGARFELLRLTSDADMPYLDHAAFGPVSAALVQAMRLAEANNHFGPNLKTAEAYYWYARLTEPNTDPAILQTILAQRDPNSPRHQEWADYASAQLEQTANRSSDD